MIAAIYARKSTDQGAVSDEQRSVTRQVEHARSFATAKGWAVDDAHIYVDDGISGAGPRGNGEPQHHDGHHDTRHSNLLTSHTHTTRGAAGAPSDRIHRGARVDEVTRALSASSSLRRCCISLSCCAARS